MINILPNDSENIIACRIEGKINTQDIETVIKSIEEKLKTNEKLRIYVEIGDFRSISLDALFEDFKFGIKNYKVFEKKAVVTDKKWMARVATVADKIFTTIEVKCFSFDEKDKAMEWVRD